MPTYSRADFDRIGAAIGKDGAEVMEYADRFEFAACWYRTVHRAPDEAREAIEIWPNIKLTTLSFKSPPRRVQWKDLSEIFRRDAQACLAMRANPDLFDERPNAPRGPLAEAPSASRVSTSAWRPQF